MSHYIKIYPENPQERYINMVVDKIREGGLVIYPTDTVYGIGCDINNQKAVDRLARIKGTKIEKADFSFIFSDLSLLSKYTRNVDNKTFKILKAYLPGPYTFILEAGGNIPKIFRTKKKTIGIRIPDSPIIKTIVEKLGHPILTTSVKDDDEVLEYITDPALIYERYNEQVDIVIDGGNGNNVASTIVDLTGEPQVIRQGLADFIG